MSRDAIVALVSSVLMTAGGCFVGGCQLPSGFPKELAQVVEKMAVMVEQQGVLDTFTSNIEGDIFDPGIESYLIMGAGVRLVGVQGSVDLISAGTGTQLPTGVKEALIEQLKLPISDEQRDAILSILGWNRVESPHNPPPG